MENKKNSRDTNLPNQIAKMIADYISYHNLKIGDRLPSEKAMTQMFKVNRVSLREAIRGLVIINMIEVRNGVGSFVKNPKAVVSGANLQLNIHRDQLKNLLEVRKVLELYSLNSVIVNIQKDDLEELEKIIVHMEYPYVLDENLSVLDDEFHKKVNQICGNEVLVDLIESTIILSKQLWAESGEDLYKTLHESIPLHRELLEAIKKRDKDKVQDVYSSIVLLDMQNISE